jgi:hypothetical protein
VSVIPREGRYKIPIRVFGIWYLEEVEAGTDLERSNEEGLADL